MWKLFKRLLSGARCITAILGQSLWLMLFFLGWASTAQATIPASERTVLTNLYASTNGVSWNVNTNWNGGAGTECGWAGITCDVTQSHVTAIWLEFNHLVGTLSSLSGLTALQTFIVRNNQLTGSIPSFSGLTALQVFNVSSNQLTGSIPSLSGLTALAGFYVHNNQLTGSIPSLSGLTALQYFYANNNQLTGSIPSLSGLTALQYFYANNNQLTGSVPSLSGLTALQYFYANNNQLTGSVPAAPTSLVAGFSDLCSNSLVSSGNPIIDAAWDVAQGSIWLVCQTPSIPPTCTLTPSPTAISAGGTSTLTASCSPAATSYIWTGGTCTGSGASCTVTPSAITTYSVSGVNASGTGAAANATVTVSAAVPGTTPACTLTPWPPAIFAGNPSTLTASCSPAATSYIWTGGICTGSGASCTVTPSATTTYTVSGVNASGTGAAANATVSVVVPTPSCTLTPSPASISAGGTATLTASCSPVATSYVWSANAGFGVTVTTGTVSPLVTTTYTVAGTNANGTGAVANATVTVTATVPGTTPICTLTASPTLISVGGSSTLTASCSPAATSYVWSSGACSSSAASCTVTPSATTTYTVTGSNAVGSSALNSAIVTVNSAAAQYTGLWWNPNEPGWGMSITQHSSMIFAVPYTYNSEERPIWYAMSSCPILTAGSCKGDLYEMTGGSSPARSWDGEGIEKNIVGSGTLAFDDANHGRFAYTLNGVSGSKSIERQFFSNGTAQFAVDYTDLWWNPNESGWGVALTQDHGIIFAAWYTYNRKNDAIWYVASACPLLIDPLLRNGCTGDLYQVTGGSPLTANWDGSNKNVSKVGSVTFTFSDANNGLMSYNLNGVDGTRIITREGF